MISSSVASSSMLYSDAAQREVHLEDRFERLPVRVVLDQRGAQRVLERLAVLERDVPHRLHGVEVFGERYRQAGGAQFLDKPCEQIQHQAVASSLAALVMSDWYLSKMLQRVARLLGVDVLDTEEHQRAGPVERLGHRRVLLELKLTDRPHDAHDLIGEVLADLGHAGEDDLLLALEIGVVDVQVEAAPLECFGQLASVVRSAGTRAGSASPTTVPISGIDTW